MGIHDIKINRGLPAAEDRVRTAEYSEANRIAILDFENYLFANGVGSLRILSCVSTLHRFAEQLTKDFIQMDKLEVQRIVAGVERSDLADSTKQQRKAILKQFFRWLQGDNNAASWIRASTKLKSKKLPENLLTESEIKRMIAAAKNPRDKALISLLYDSGARIGELGNLKIRNVIFDEYGAVIEIKGKTGPRRTRIMFSMSYISTWIDNHPNRKKPEDFLFINLTGKNSGKQMGHDGIHKAIKKAAELAGIEKRVYNHLFRHSRATELAKHLTEAQMDSYLGWVPGSNMPAVYVHLSGRDTDEAILRMYGKSTKEEKLPELISRTCARCGKENGPTTRYCAGCGLPLDIEAMQEVDESRAKLMRAIELMMKDEEIRTLLDKV
ncbi:tyrosine-type recombinase/integrase [Methanosarcina siciliae]|uniref:tyrosine-type recombinase/integrase n=1 Tax=Methanosarcina siciliae TaxID=38027 RepID=UPI0009E28EE9|nr:tyrosine-type recombinase/integrase [Methanosarcina siciliae]